jgi:glycosyltransferase involved in cell wall biosynthesis
LVRQEESGMADFILCCNSHSRAIRAANLDRSPCTSTTPVRIEERAETASVGYNRAIDASDEPILVFLHHDVYLPQGWDALLRARIAEIEAVDPNWAVLGAYGLAPDHSAWGPVWSSSLGMILGRVPLAPTPAEAVDEMLIVVRRASGIRFDETLPGWHLYGTDIAQTALARGLGVYAGGLPLIHNDGFKAELGKEFDLCYQYMQRKWRSRLPLATPVTRITKNGLHRFRERREERNSQAFRKTLAVDVNHDVELFAAACGWSDLTATARSLERLCGPLALAGSAGERDAQGQH